MCLKINSSYHPKHAPFIADRPLMVYKALDYNSLVGAYASPFYGKVYRFGRKYKSKFSYDGNSNGYVEAGLHAFTKKDASRSWVGNHMFPAIIPKGAKVWLGFNDEICSNELIVYKDKESMLKAFGADKTATPISKKKAAGL